MNSTRMRFGFLVLAVYAVLGVIGVYSQAPGAQGQEVSTTRVRLPERPLK